MKSLAMALDLKDDPRLIKEYLEYHKAVWPEALEGLKRIGISKMIIFRHGTRLFMYFKAPDDFDVVRDFAKYMDTERAREWDNLMRNYQQKAPGAREDEWWSSMEEVFDLYAG